VQVLAREGHTGERVAAAEVVEVADDVAEAVADEVAEDVICASTKVNQTNNTINASLIFQFFTHQSGSREIVKSRILIR